MTGEDLTATYEEHRLIGQKPNASSLLDYVTNLMDAHSLQPSYVESTDRRRRTKDFLRL